MDSSNRYQLGESTFIFRGARSDFYFLSHFSMKFLCANRIAPDGTPRSAFCSFNVVEHLKQNVESYTEFKTYRCHDQTDGCVRRPPGVVCIYCVQGNDTKYDNIAVIKRWICPRNIDKDVAEVVDVNEVFVEDIIEIIYTVLYSIVG